MDETAQRTGFAHLEPELTLVPGAQPWLRLRISDGGRQYVVKSIPNLMEAVEMGKSVSYGKALALCTGGMPLMKSPVRFCSCCAVR